ncbi:MAG: Ig-like domain-containing protein [Elusimicrobia bacterium]|nr:Ig-like domain-containing protein [Candidatus Liberimonas magnetica]
MASGTIVTGTLSATDGDFFSRVVLNVADAKCLSGTTYYYKVSALFGSAEGVKSAPNQGWGQGSIDPNGYDYNFSFTVAGTLYNITTSSSSIYNNFDASPPALNIPNTSATEGTYYDKVKLTATGASITQGSVYYYKAKVKTNDGVASGFSNQNSGYCKGAVDTNGYQFEYSTSATSANYYEVSSSTSSVYDFTGSSRPTINPPTSVSAGDGPAGGIVINVAGASVNSGAVYYYRARYKTTDSVYSDYSHTSGGDAGYSADTINPDGYKFYRSSAGSNGPYYEIASSTQTSFHDYTATGTITSPSNVTASTNQPAQVNLSWSGELITGATYWYKVKSKSLLGGATSQLSTWDQGSSVPGVTKFSVYCDTIASNGNYSTWKSSPTGHTFSDSGLAANFGPVYYKIKSYSPDCGWTSLSLSTGVGYTRAAIPQVSCISKSSNTWYNSSSFTFLNEHGWNATGVAKYKIVWDTNTTHTFSGAEIDWVESSSGTIAAIEGSWYLHLKSYNKANQTDASLEKTFGPYCYDKTTPAIDITFPVTDNWYNVVITSFMGTAQDSGGAGISTTTYQYRINAGTWINFNSENSLPDWKNTAQIIGETASKTIEVKVKDKAANSDISNLVTVKVDTTPPQGVMAITFPEVAVASMSIVANKLVDLTEGSTFYKFTCVTDPSYDTAWQVNNSTTCSGLGQNKQYTFKYQVRDGLGNATSQSVEFSTYTLAKQPLTGYVSSLSSGSINAFWGDNGNPGGTQYFCQLSSQTPFAALANSGWVTSYPFAFVNLIPDTTYWARVKARNFAGRETAYVNLGSTHTPCSRPVDLRCKTAGSTNLEIEWQPNNNPPTTLYEVITSSNGSNYSTVFSTTSLSFLHTGLAANTTHYYKVRARNANMVYTGYTLASTTHTLCNQPGGINFVSANTSSVSLQWDTSSNSVSTLYELSASTGSSSNYGLIHTGKSSSYTHSTLTSNCTYYYKVRAKNLDNVYTDYTTPVDTYTLCAVPGVNSFTSVSATQIDLGWTENNNSNSTVYTLESSSETNTNYKIMYQGLDKNYNHTSLSPNVTYYFRVQATALSGIKTGFNTVLSTHTLCNDPADLAFNSVNSSNISVSWSKNNNSNSAVYELEASTGSSSTYGVVYTGYNVSYLHNSLKANTTYYYKVRAKNLDGAYSGYTAVITTFTVCNQPVNLHVSTASQNSVSVEWSTNNNSNETLYEVAASSGSGFETIFAGKNSGTIHSSLTPNVTYYYKVRSKALNGLYTQYTAQVTTHTLCSTPGSVSFVSVLENQIGLNWTDNGNSASTRYTLESSSGTSGNYKNIYQGINKNYTHTTLSPNVTYYYRVYATNHDGVQTSPALAKSTHTLCKEPAQLHFTVAGSSANSISWNTNDNSGSTFYEVQASTYNSSSYGTVYIGKNTGYNHSGLVPNVTYYYKVLAKNLDGVRTSYTSQVTTHTLCTIPGAVYFTSVDTAQIQLGWSKNNNSDSTVYELIVSSTLVSWNPETSGYSNSYLDPGLALNTTYWYRVRAKNLDNVYSYYSVLSGTATLVNSPVAEAFSEVEVSSLTAHWQENSNPSGTRYLCQASEVVPFSPVKSSGWVLAQSYSFSQLSANSTYWFRVKGRSHSARETDWVNLGSTVTRIESPTGVIFGSVTSSSIEVAPSGTFTNLNISKSGVIVYETTVSSDSGWRKASNYWVLSGLNPSTTYYFCSRTRNMNGRENPLTLNYSKATKAQAPPSPSIVGVSTSSVSLVINTGLNPANVAYSIRFVGNGNTKYVQPNYTLGDSQVYKSTSAWNGTIETIGLLQNTSYYVSVSARNSFMESTDYSASVSTYTLLNRPDASDITLVPNSGQDIQVSVSNPIQAFSGYTGSEFECTSGAGGSNSGVLPGAYNYTDSGLNANGLYSYRAKYRNACGVWTNYSEVLSTYTRIEPASGVEFGTVTSSSIEVRPQGTFSNITSGSSGVSLYNITTSSSSGWYKEPLAYRVFSGLAPNTLYSFNSNSRNILGLPNTPCTTATKYTLANTPVNPAAVAQGNALASTKGYVELSWERNFNPPGTIYELYCLNNSSVVYTGSAIAYVNTNLNDQTTYYYKLRAKNYGNLYTLYTSTVSAYTPDRTAPAQLVKPVAINKIGFDGLITLSWTTGPESDIKGFNIYYATYTFSNIIQNNVTLYSNSPQTNPDAGTCDIEGLSGNLTYYFAVTAQDITGNEHFAVTPSDDSRPLDRMAPNRILDLAAASGSTDGAVELIWTAPGNNGNAGKASSYIIKYAEYPITETNFNSSSLYIERDVTVASGNRDSESVVGLTPGKFYYFAIAAVDNSSNTSLVSNSSGTYSYIPLTILTAETVDDNLNGQIDAYRIVFSTNVNDSSLAQSGTSGFGVAKYSNAVFVSSGLPNHPDTVNNSQVYVRFKESGLADTNAKPELTYAKATGYLRNLCGTYLSDVSESDITEIDAVGPVLLSASASDASGGLPGIQANDKVQLVFSENTNTPAITKLNIDDVFVLSNGHTWKDGAGKIVSALWLVPNILELKLADNVVVPSIVVGDTVTVSGLLIKDAAGNASLNSLKISGDFGLDVSRPTIVSRETMDLNKNGYIDALKITFSKPIKDSNLVFDRFHIAGVSDVSFSSDTNDDSANNRVIYFTFKDNVLTTDKTPTLQAEESAISDMNDNTNEFSPATPSSDKAAPVMAAAISEDGGILIPGVDGDDTAVITFSEETIQPNITSSNIDSVFVLSSSHTWGNIGSAEWNKTGNAVTVRFSSMSYRASIVVGDTITIDGSRIKDLAGNGIACSIVLSGSFVGIDKVSPQIVSVAPKDKQEGVVPEALIGIVFSENMDKNNAENSISLHMVRDKDGQTAYTAVTGNKNYDFKNKELTFTPIAPLSKSCIYEVAVSTLAADTIGNRLEGRFTSRFTTVLDNTQDSTIIDNTNTTKIVIESGILPPDCVVSVITDPIRDCKEEDRNSIIAAVQEIKKTNNPFNVVLEDCIREIIVTSPDGQAVERIFEKPIMLTIAYHDDDNNGIVDKTCPPIRETSLVVSYLDTKHNLWVRLPGSKVDAVNKTVTAPCRHFSIFAILGAPAMDLSFAYAFPVPFKAQDNSITFTNLSSNAVIKIYTVTGELVKTINHTSGDAQDTWDVKNEQGEAVASGTYLYLIKNEQEMKKGKLVIIR